MRHFGIIEMGGGGGGPGVPFILSKINLGQNEKEQLTPLPPKQ